MTLIAGPYTATYAAVSIGITEGLQLNHVFYKQPVTGDNQGRSVQDAVYQGCDVTSDFALLEWDLASVEDMFWPYGASFLTAAVPGRVDIASSLVSSLVLTAVAGTTAAADHASVTLPRSIIHEDFPVNHIFRPELRRVPMRLRHYPDATYVYGTIV